MTWEDQVFAANVVVTHSMQETMALNFISWPTCVATKLSAIVKICKSKRLQEGYHFILMAMEVHDTRECDMDRFIKERAHFFHDRRPRGYLSFFLHLIS
jgi:hypothetical protein